MNSTIKHSGVILLAILFQSYGTSFAQNYKALKTDASYYFYDSTSMEIIAERIDSIALVGDETHYYAMRQIRETDYNCFIPNGASWLGDVVIEKPDGLFRFVLYPFSPADSSDIYTIKSKATIGENWHFYNYHTINHYVEATVTLVNLVNFIGFSDSVKTITLQRKDASGQIVDDPVNGQAICLSKNYGLIRLPKFDEFITNQKFLDLCGKTNPVTGKTNLTFEEIFDFQPGDVFHTHYLSTPFVYYYPTQEGSVIKTILEKIAGSNPDTVIYRIARCMTNASSAGMNQIVYTHTFDTIIDHYYSNDYKTLPTEPKEPYILNEGMEYLSDNMMGLSVNSFMNLTNIPWKFTDASGIFWRQEFPDCWNYATFDDYTSAYFFYKGLGGPYYSWMGPALNFSYNKLVYYKKGSETWGTPLDCDSLLQVSLHEFPEQLKAKIYPNPTFGTVTVSFPAGIRFSPCKLEVIDVSGRLSATFNMSQQTLSFDLGDLPSGLYTYKITSVKGDIIRGKIIKQ